MRCYKKPFSWDLVDSEALPVWQNGFHHASPARDLPTWLYFVHVCSFRFVFVSLSQINEYREFYALPLKPSFRYTDAANGEHNLWANVRQRSYFHKLPLYLWENGKRERVVAALDRAIRTFAKG